MTLDHVMEGLLSQEEPANNLEEQGSHKTRSRMVVLIASHIRNILIKRYNDMASYKKNCMKNKVTF